MVNKKRRVGIVFLIIAILIVFGLLTYFVVKGLSSSTGKVVDNNGITYNTIANDARVTMPAKAADNSPDLSSNNPRLQ